MSSICSSVNRMCLRICFNKLKWVWLKFPSRKINEIFIWKFVDFGCVHVCMCVILWKKWKRQREEREKNRTQLHLTFVSKWAVKRVSYGTAKEQFVRQHAEIMANTKQSNLILFNNIAADFTQINWIRKALSSRWIFTPTNFQS